MNINETAHFSRCEAGGLTAAGLCGRMETRHQRARGFFLETHLNQNRILGTESPCLTGRHVSCLVSQPVQMARPKVKHGVFVWLTE